MAPGRIEEGGADRDQGVGPRARRPGLLTIAPPMPNRALSTPVANPRSSEGVAQEPGLHGRLAGRRAVATSGLANSSKA